MDNEGSDTHVQKEWGLIHMYKMDAINVYINKTRVSNVQILMIANIINTVNQ